MSQIVALYYIVAFYECTVELLEPHRPLMKFIVIKAVVFFSFWQAVAIAVIVKLGWIEGTPEFPEEKMSQFVQAALICFEMFVASFAHHSAFPHQPYVHERKDEADEPDEEAGDGGIFRKAKKGGEAKTNAGISFLRMVQLTTSAAKDIVVQTDVVDDTLEHFSRDDTDKIEKCAHCRPHRCRLPLLFGTSLRSACGALHCRPHRRLRPR